MDERACIIAAVLFVYYSIGWMGACVCGDTYYALNFLVIYRKLSEIVSI